jgi:hypothetical protein
MVFKGGEIAGILRLKEDEMDLWGLSFTRVAAGALVLMCGVSEGAGSGRQVRVRTTRVGFRLELPR